MSSVVLGRGSSRGQRANLDRYRGIKGEEAKCRDAKVIAIYQKSENRAERVSQLLVERYR